MVSLTITASEIGCIVRFQREVWCPPLGRTYIDTDLIIIIDSMHEQNLRDDFSLYQQLDVGAQMNFIAKLRLEHYTGRRLADSILRAEEAELLIPTLGLPRAITTAIEKSETQQFALF